MNYDHVEAFKAFIKDSGMIPPSFLEPGKSYRCPDVGKQKGNTDGSIKYFADGVGGYVIGFASGIAEGWQAKKNSDFSPKQRDAFTANVKKSQQEAEQERKRRVEEVVAKAKRLWNNTTTTTEEHQYCTDKHISTECSGSIHSTECDEQFYTSGEGGAEKLVGDLLILPLFDSEFGLRAVQAIDIRGNKSFLKGTKKEGLFAPTSIYALPGDFSGKICISEGWSTAKTVGELTGNESIAALDKSNLLSVAVAIHKTYPRAKITIYGDVDRDGGGQKKAYEAAVAVDVCACFPPFSEEDLSGKNPPSDFNDYVRLYPSKINVMDLIGARDASGGKDQLILGELKREEIIAKAIAEVNLRFAWMQKYGKIYRIDFSDFIPTDGFKTEHANKVIEIPRKLNVPGSPNKPINLGVTWLNHPDRLELRSLVFKPGEEVGRNSDNDFNMWTGFETSPKKGDVAPWLDLLTRMVPDAGNQAYILEWLGHLFQHPGIKMHSSLLFWSPEQGVGKNLLFDCIRLLIGPSHSCGIRQPELLGPFNFWAENKILVIADEISSTNKRSDENVIKGLITDIDLTFNRKFQPQITLPNLANYIFLSNHEDALHIDPNDRRHHICKIESERLNDEYATRFIKWRKTGLPALLHHFLTCDLSKFNPHSQAPVSHAKKQMIIDSQSEVERWAEALIENIDMDTQFNVVVSTVDLPTRYFNDTGYRSYSKTINAALRKFGAGDQKRITLPNKEKITVIALKDADYWKTKPERMWIKALKTLNSSCNY